MLVDIDFVPFTQDQLDRYRALAEDHNAKLEPGDSPMDLEPKHPPRYGHGLYVAHEIRQREVIQQFVDDVPSYLNFGDRDPYSYDRYEDRRLTHKRKMDKLYSQKYKRGPYRDFCGMGNYGLCDTPEQFLADYPHIADDEVPRFIAFYGIMRQHQHPTGGFRYHKNGPWRGRQKIRSEYLYDDTHIDMICGYHVYRVEDVVSG